MSEPYAASVDGFRIAYDSLACGLAANIGKPVITPDVTKEPRWQPWLWLAEQYNYRACWSFPVETSAGKIISTFAMYFPEPREPTNREIEIANILTQTAATIIARYHEAEERVRVENMLREREERQAFLLKLSDALRPLSDPLAVQETAARLLGEELAADRLMYVEVLETDSGHEYVVERNYLAGRSTPAVIGRVAAAEFGPLLVKESRAGQTMVVADVENEPRLSPNERDAFLKLGVKAYITTPLIKISKWVASVTVQHLTPRSWKPQEVALVEEVAERIWAAVARARAEEAMRASEERLRLLIESAEDYAIFTMTPDNRVNYWNAGAERIFGYTEQEILGESGAILFTPEDRARGVPEEEMRTAAAIGRASDERWHVDKYGKRFYCSGVTMPLRSGDTLRGFAKIARDLTSQKRAGEQLRRAHDELEDHVRERTAELVELNQTLRTEINERTVAEERARLFMQQVVTAQEDERRKIARDLHDHLGQQLTGLRLQLQHHKETCGDHQLQKQVEQIQLIAQQIR